MRIRTFAPYKDSKVSYFTSDDLRFHCKMEGRGKRRALPAKSKKVGSHVENSRNYVRV